MNRLVVFKVPLRIVFFFLTHKMFPSKAEGGIGFAGSSRLLSPVSALRVKLWQEPGAAFLRRFGRDRETKR